MEKYDVAILWAIICDVVLKRPNCVRYNKLKQFYRPYFLKEVLMSNTGREYSLLLLLHTTSSTYHAKPVIVAQSHSIKHYS